MNDAGHAILKVDNASEVLLGEKRNSVRSSHFSLPTSR